MRVGKKSTIIETKQIRPCIVRLEKVQLDEQKSVSCKKFKTFVSQKKTKPSTPANIRVTRLSLAAMGATPKAAATEEKKFKGPLKKRPISNTLQSTPQQKKVSEKVLSTTMRSSQKMKVVHRISKEMSSEHEEEESLPPTIAAGRSRRAIKPNPKYASEDMLTPKLIRNVGSSSGKIMMGSAESKRRSGSSSSDDFFNRDSSDEMDATQHNNYDGSGTDDVAYQADEKDGGDSDFSEPVVEKSPPRPARGRGRPRKIQPESLVHTATKSGSLTSTPSNRVVQVASNNVRTQPSQLQQIRRSLATATAQRNFNLLGGEKRKLDKMGDSDGEANTSMKRKQIVITSQGQRVGVPVKDVKENSNAANTPTTATRIIRTITPASLQTLNGNKVMKTQTPSTKVLTSTGDKRKVLDATKNHPGKRILIKSPLNKALITNASLEGKSAVSTATASYTPTQAKILAARATATAAASRLHVDSSKLQMKDNLKTISKINNNNNSTATTASLKKPGMIPTQGNKTQTTTKSSVASSNFTSKTSSPKAEENPNSSADDFETMPTFTIVNVNDIINKKGDVLITKSKNANNKTISEDTITLHDEDVALNNQRERSTPSALNRLASETSRKGGTTGQHQILNHKIAMRNARSTSSVKPIIAPPSSKPAPRILNSMVAKKTRPVKPLIANMDDSADESIPLSLDDETEDEQERKQKGVEEIDLHGTEDEAEIKATATGPYKHKQQHQQQQQQQQHQHKKALVKNNLPVVNRKRGLGVSSSLSAKENSLSAFNQQSNTTKTPAPAQQGPRKLTPEKVVISRQGDKIIKKITCFETWYVINVKNERPHLERSQFEMPLIKLANVCKTIPLPSAHWSCKVTLYELSTATLAKSITFITYTGDLQDHNIAEEDRAKYQPSCVMFRRSVGDRQKSRMPYDRAVIFKNKTFYTNIEGKNVKLVGAPNIITSIDDVEILLQIVDSLSLTSDFVEQATTMQ